MTRFFISRPVPSNASLIMCSLKFILPAAALFLCRTVSQAEETAYSSATIPGSGRAISVRPAIERGRISALAAARRALRQNHSLRGAASGGVWKSDDGGTRYRPVFASSRCSRWRHRARTQKTLMISRTGDAGHATASRSETGLQIPAGARAGPMQASELRAGAEDHSKSKKSSDTVYAAVRAHCGAIGRSRSLQD